MKNCGAGMPNNYVIIVHNLIDNAFRDIKNCPCNRKAIWNKFGTKAVFYPETRVCAGCEKASIIGYDIANDEAKDISSEKAAYNSINCGNKKNCWANCGSPASVSGTCLSAWYNLPWLDDKNMSVMIISPSGGKKNSFSCFKLKHRTLFDHLE